MAKEEMKELYETGGYVAYTDNNGVWRKTPKQSSLIMWNLNHVLIHKRHAKIAEEVAKNPDVEVEVRDKYTILTSHPPQAKWDFVEYFFEGYSEDEDYRLKPKEEKEDEQRQSRNNNNSDMDLEKNRETISITAPDGIVYGFEKPNSFDVEIERVIGTRAYGYIYNDKLINGIAQQSWDLIDGKGSSYLIDGNQNLTPIKKEWYEDENLLPIIVYSDLKGLEILNTFGDKRNSHRLATKEEVMSLYWKNK